MLGLRRSEPALRRGRQYLREISGDGLDFGWPTGFGGPVLGVVGWSRLLADREVLCVLNTDTAQAHAAWVTIDAVLHHAGDRLRLLHAVAPDPAAAFPVAVPVQARNGMAALIELPAGGFAAYGADLAGDPAAR